MIAFEKYYLRKGREVITTALSVICPRQEQEIWSSLQQTPHLFYNENPGESSKRGYFDQNCRIMDALVKAHDEAESWQTKRQILSLFANDFSRAQLQKIPGLSKWRIDQARQHLIHTGKGQPVKEQKSSAEKLMLQKLITSLILFHAQNVFRMWHSGSGTYSGEQINIQH